MMTAPSPVPTRTLPLKILRHVILATPGSLILMSASSKLIAIYFLGFFHIYIQSSPSAAITVPLRHFSFAKSL